MSRNRSRTSSMSSRTSNNSTSKQQPTMSVSESLPFTADKPPVMSSLQVPKLTKTRNDKQKPPQKPSKHADDTDSKIDDESELIARHCRDSEFFRDLSLIQKAIVNSNQGTPKKTTFAKVDFTFDDFTLTEDLTDMTPTKDSTHYSSGQHDMSMQADKAANLLIKVSFLRPASQILLKTRNLMDFQDIKTSVGITKSDTTKNNT